MQSLLKSGNLALLHSELVKKILWRSLHALGKQGINFVLFLLSVALLSVYDFGIYSWALAIALTLAIFCDLGISASVSKFVAQYSLSNDSKLEHILGSSFALIIALSIFVCAVFFIFSPIFFEPIIPYVWYVAPLLTLIPVSALYDGFFRGLGQVREVSIVSIVAGLITLPIAYLAIQKFGVAGALSSQIIYYFFLCGGSGYLARNQKYRFSAVIAKEVGKYSFYIGLIWVSYFLYSRVDIILLGHFGFIQEISYFEVVNKIIMLLLLPGSIISQVAAPYVVKMYLQSKTQVLTLLRRTILYGGLGSAILSLFTTLIVVPVLYLSGSEYLNNTVLFIFIIYLFLFVFQNVADIIGNTFIISTGHAKLNTINIAIFGLLNCVCDIAFILLFGYVGVVYSKLIIVSGGSLSLIAVYYLKLRRELVPEI